jgi:hypothetical protein
MNSGEKLIMTDRAIFWFRNINRMLHAHSLTAALYTQLAMPLTVLTFALFMRVHYSKLCIIKLLRMRSIFWANVWCIILETSCTEINIYTFLSTF